MGWRFRKSVKIAPGIRLNFSKSGISTSVGVKGARITFGPDGTYVNTGIPGTGLYNREKVSFKHSENTTYNENSFLHETTSEEELPISHHFIQFKSQCYCVYIVALLLSFIGGILYTIDNVLSFVVALFMSVFQFFCCSHVCYNYKRVNNGNSSCYRLLSEDEKINVKSYILGHIFRGLMALIATAFSLIPLFSTFDLFKDFHVRILFILSNIVGNISTHDCGFIVLLISVIVALLWCFIFIQESIFAYSCYAFRDELSSKNTLNLSLTKDNTDTNHIVSIANTHNKETKADTTKEENNFSDKHIPVTSSINTPINPREPFLNYKFPTLDLLKRYENDGKTYVDRNEQEANKNRIISVLRNFGVEIDSITATIGPTITLYEITPKPGVRISKIKNLEDDIALSLAALGIRIIAPMPGKGTIGIEVPNANPSVVSMLSILNSRKFQETQMELPLALGKTITNEVFMVDLAKIPHLLVAGATGQGKSVGMNAIITSLLYKKHPNELKFVLVDPKKVEFSVYAPIADHFMASVDENVDEPIITDTQKVIKTLKGLCTLMDSRYDLLKRAGARNVKEYNKKYLSHLLNPQDGHEFMPYIVIIIDEFADLIITAGKEIEIPITRIAQLARAVGMHMVIATQRPSTKVITGGIKANFPGRIAFKVSSRIDSSIILDRTGAHQLIGRGDMLYSAGNEPVRVQCAFVDTPEVERINQYVAKQSGPTEPYPIPEPLSEDTGFGGSEGGVDIQTMDPLFVEAARHIIQTQQGSTSMIQRRFSIGYNRANRLMDQMERAGVVGAAQGSKLREVLISDEASLEAIIARMRA